MTPQRKLGFKLYAVAIALMLAVAYWVFSTPSKTRAPVAPMQQHSSAPALGGGIFFLDIY